MMGTLLIQQMFDFTDEETVRQFAFNIEWHYALDITDNSDEVFWGINPRDVQRQKMPTMRGCDPEFWHLS